jgi:hypothetical protein
MFLDGYVKASNKLLRAVVADIQCLPLISGIRSLGILHRHFTDPFWRIMEDPEIHIIDLGRYIKHAYETLGQWKQDASPLLERNLSPVFKKLDGFEFIPCRDHVFESLYAQVVDEMNLLTKQALESCCSSMHLVMERRYADYLHGKYSGDTSEGNWENYEIKQKLGRMTLAFGIGLKKTVKDRILQIASFTKVDCTCLYADL